MAPGNLLDATWRASPGRAFPEIPDFYLTVGTSAVRHLTVLCYIALPGAGFHRLSRPQNWQMSACTLTLSGASSLAAIHQACTTMGGILLREHDGYGLITTKPQSSWRTSSDLSEKLNELTTAVQSPTINLLAMKAYMWSLWFWLQGHTT